MIFPGSRNNRAGRGLPWRLLYRMAFSGFSGSIAGAVLCAGCTTMTQLKNKIGSPAPTPAVSSQNAAQSRLNEGIELYERGDFNGAIKHLSNAPEIWSADKTVQTKALKYMAFSYCVTSRAALCRQQFEKALKLDPAFDLAPGEKGHPQWGPVFDRVKKAK
jgi:tetratricopeptide (TPR) repeat protein